MDVFKVAVIIAAAGSSRRFVADAALPAGGNKIELDLAGRPVFLRAVELFIGRADVCQVIVAVNPEHIEAFRLRWGDKLSFVGAQIVAGGTKERWETVLKALAAVRDGCTHVAVHDAARPLASAAMIDRAFEAARSHPAVIPGVSVVPTLKRVVPLTLPSNEKDALDMLLGGAGRPAVILRKVTCTVDRADLIEVQSPQIFEVTLLRQAYQRLAAGELAGRSITDDAGLIEAMGQDVIVFEGEVTNFKITRPQDLELARALLGAREQTKAASLAKKRLFTDEDDQ